MEEEGWIKVPEKFPEGSEFVASFSGDEYVRLPGGKVFKLDDGGELLMPVRSLPLKGAPISEGAFLNCAKSCRDFAASKAAS